jgi:hypothetical protein
VAAGLVVAGLVAAGLVVELGPTVAGVLVAAGLLVRPGAGAPVVAAAQLHRASVTRTPTARRCGADTQDTLARLR